MVALKQERITLLFLTVRLNDSHEPSLSDLLNMQGFSILSENKGHRICCAPHSQAGTMYQKLSVIYWKM